MWEIELAGEYLFTQIFFSPRPSAMQFFESLSMHERFSKTIVHLTFDDTQLPRKANFCSALSKKDHLSRHGKKVMFDGYRKLFARQESILHHNKDYDLLVRGLCRLPRLNKVTIIGGPSRNRNTPYHYEYESYSADLADVGIQPSYWSYFEGYPKLYQKWDGRPIQHLWRALCVANVRPSVFHIGNWQDRPKHRSLKMGIPLSTLKVHCQAGNEMFASIVDTVFCNLTSLNLHIDMHPRGLRDVDYFDTDLDILFNVVPALAGLKRLTLGFAHWDLHARETRRLLDGRPWPLLDCFRLRNAQITPELLTEFLFGHKETLKHLFFDRVGFESECRGTWDDVLIRIKPFMTLRDAEFNSVYEWMDDRGNDERVDVEGSYLARFMMTEGAVRPC